ncbi:MAG: hypothetical protein KA536_22260 [Saprospiraceae bacterium]|nr:hypothetical protein [Saprospiraceae bacterium]
MSIEKIWINRKESGHNFILFHNHILYRRKVNKDSISLVENELKHEKISDKFIGLPISYIKKIEFRDDDKFINISYGSDSVDSIEINDQPLRKEVFEYLKTNTNLKKNYIKKPGFLYRIKKPLIALLVVIGIFSYVYSIMNGLNQGDEYEIVGGRRGGAGLGGIILGLAHFGLMINILIFAPLALIAMYRIKKNLDNDSEIHYIEY